LVSATSKVAEMQRKAPYGVGPCSPRERGAKIIVLDPRMTPLARTVDLFIPVRAGGNIGVFNGMLNVSE
jgi:hypothetical protein